MARPYRRRYYESTRRNQCERDNHFCGRPKYFLDEQDIIDFEGTKLNIFFTPGHSPGHICFYNKSSNILISGDVIFKNSIGRTDLPGGDYTTLMNSITSKILCLPEKTSIFCGHGDVTSLADEKKYNPFLQ